MKISQSIAIFAILLPLIYISSAIAGPAQKQSATTVKQTTPSAQQTPVAASQPLPVEKPPSVTIPATGQPVAAQKLSDSIKINSNDLAGIKAAEIAVLSNAFYAAWKRVSDSCSDMSILLPAYEQQTRAYIAKCQECRNRSYSQQEMILAGCAGSDTVADCSKKLYRWCSAPSEPSILGILGALSVIDEYDKTAKDEFVKSVLHQK